MGRRINLGQSFEKSVNIIIDFVDEVQNEATKIFEELEACNKENSYKLLNDVSRNLQQEYNESVLDGIKKFIHDWDGSEYNFVNYCKRNIVGEETESLALRQQGYLRDKIDTIRELDIIQVLIDETDYERDNIAKKLEEIERNSKKLEDIYEDKKAEFTSLKKENEAIDIIEPIIISYSGVIASFIEQCSRSINQIMDDSLVVMKNQSDTTNEEFNDISTQVLEDSAETINRVRAHLMNLIQK